MSSPLYLVTGAMGHLGNIVIGKLRQQGVQVRGLALEAIYIKLFGGAGRPFCSLF